MLKQVKLKQANITKLITYNNLIENYNPNIKVSIYINQYSKIMKRAGDGSYNIMAGRSRTAAIPNEALSNGHRSSKRSQVESELIDSAFAKNAQAAGHARTFYKKRASNNAGYKNTTTHMGRAASAIDAAQVRNTSQSAFNYKGNNLDRSGNRSGIHKNQALLQSHYGLSANIANNSSFGFYQGKKFRGLNSTSNNKQFAKTNNDHSALKQFAIEQLSLITQSQYREEEKERQQILQSDRPVAKQAYGRSRSRTKWLKDEDTKSDIVPQPFMLTKTAQRADDTAAQRQNKEKHWDAQVRMKFQPYQENNLQRFDHLIASTKSEGRAQKNLQHFRQLSKNPKRIGTEHDAVNSGDNVEPRKQTDKNVQQDGDTTKSTAAQSSEVPKNNLLRQISQEKNKSFLKKLETNKIDLPYKKNMQKQYLCRQIRDRLRKEFCAMFRNAEQAYAALDYTGTGHISEEAFLKSQVVSKRIPFTTEQIRLYFTDYNLFHKESPGLDFDTFKKNFFPHLYLVGDPADDEADKDAEKNRNEIRTHGEAYNKIVEKRVQKLESKLKEKFSNCFESVRKAFLALDTDFDGFVTVEDILKYFGTDTDLNYNELKKLMNDKDAKKQGKLNYPDFSKWLGNTIHMPQGFYFRHDSVLNPQFEQQLEMQDKTQKTMDRAEVTKILLGTDIENKILEKIKFQWKTIRKAFQDMNVSKTGKITEEEFKYFLQFWGMTITQEQFIAVFNKFDLDGDGALSYKDFQQSIGAEMFPAEGLYFRQDKAQQCRVNACKQNECWQPTKNTLNYCDVHQKMHQDHAVQHFSKLFRQIGHKWQQFISTVRAAADGDDESQIPFSSFVKISRQFGGRLEQDELQQILAAYPGKEGGDQGVRVDIGRIYDQKYHQILQKVYDKMDFAITGGEDEPIDEIGYIGKTLHQREKVGPLKEISHAEFVHIIYKNNKLKEIMFLISQIDNHTGCVTKNELDDIVKKQYPEQLKDKNLIPIISMFSSIQNKILIDHQKFRDWILKGLAKIELKVEKKRLMNKQYRKPRDNQVTALDLLAHQNQGKVDKIESQEHQITNQKGRRLERSESQRPGMTRELLESQFGAKQEDKNASHGGAKYRPASSNRAFSSKRGSAAPNVTSKLVPDLEGPQLNNHDNSLIQQKYFRRPHSSIGSGAYHSRGVENQYVGSQSRRRENEYVNIKDLIKNDNHYGGTIDEGKRFGSNTRNRTALHTVDPASIVNEYQTGNTSKNYHSKASSVKRRPYSSIHGMNRGSGIDMKTFGAGARDEKVAGHNTIMGGRSQSNLLVDGARLRTDDLAKMASDTNLLEAYSNSRLVATSDKMMRRLINWDPLGSQRQKTIDPNMETNDYRDEIRYYEAREGVDGQYSEDQDRDARSAKERSPGTGEKNYDSIDKRNGSTNKRPPRRSESATRPMNRTFSGEPGLRNATMEAGSSAEARGNSVDNSQFARFMRLHKSLHLKQSQASRSKVTSVSYTPKEPVSAAYHVSHQPSSSDKQMVSNKLAYEWKNVYRNILQVNADGAAREKFGSSDYVSLRDFDEVCQKFRVNFTKEELNKIQKLFAANARSKHVVGEGAPDSLRGVINYVAISHVMGLHRASYNHLGAHTLANQRSRSIFKLRHLYKSIEPVEEEQPNAGDGDADHQGRLQAGRRRASLSRSKGGSSQIYKLKQLKKELGSRAEARQSDAPARGGRHTTMELGQRSRTQLASDGDLDRFGPERWMKTPQREIKINPNDAIMSRRRSRLNPGAAAPYGGK